MSDTGPLDTRLALAHALARQLRAWSLAQGAPAEAAAAVAQAVRVLSVAASEGHVCVRLDDDSSWQAAPACGPDAGTRRRLLRASRVVADATAPGVLPLVLDSDGRLYTHRLFEHESALATRLARATQSEPAIHEAQPLASAPSRATADDEQQRAIDHAMACRLTLISGGPGSGKTTTVARLLAAVLAREPEARIALAAPTGKAAARLAESLQQRAAALPAAQRLPQDASTLHRLLRWGPAQRRHGGFLHHAGEPLALDWLVVDEASMLDLALARRLFDAVPEHAHVVLLGDAHQLAAVEAGAVFAELAGSGSVAAVRLSRSHRFAAGSAIARLARCVLQGDAEGALALLGSGGDELSWHAEASLDLSAIEAAWRPYAEVLRGRPGEAADTATAHAVHAAHAAHAALARCRVLAATRRGPRGVQRINRHLDAWVRARIEGHDGPARGPAIGASDWYAGRPVLITRNQPELGLYNGDLGIALHTEPGGPLALAIADRPGLAPVAPARVAELESAYAMTVHKAQGSEADEVLLVLPEPPSAVLTRELLYTAVTRARQRVTVFASVAALRAAISTPTRRASGLAARLAGR